MKKFAAAAVAAAMTLSTLAPAADAASNKISYANGGTWCTVKLDGEKSFPTSPTQAQTLLRNIDDKSGEFYAGSSKIGEAFGGEPRPAVENYKALKACVDGKDYQTTPLNQAEKVGIIMGIVLGVLATLAPMVAPYVKKYLPF